MVHTMRSISLALLLIYLCINLTAAEVPALRFHRRQDSSTTPTSAPTTAAESSTPISSRLSGTGESRSVNGGGDSSTATANTSPTESASVTSSNPNPDHSSSSRSTAATTTQASASAVTSNINGPSATDSFNHSVYNSTLTPGKLPVTPQITPSFAVGGVILMLTGVVYTFVGIKNKWLHIFLSASYLASVSITVLIIYVMNPPISSAIQGAYLVAVVMTGLILGGASTVFSEMTEGLGCLLGGFSFSMWLLVLKPGGLITTTGGKSIFIAAFTLVSFATSFSHYTRDYGLIISISFGGATAIVLGIDCFSRAGLKEFWAYIWDLNTNLFPLGATTYPLTRGMKVEIAAIIIIFLAGIVSQLKLWKVIKERRQHRAAERLQDERTMEQEEENAGKRIENSNAQARDQWEAVYGDKDAVKLAADPLQRDSGVGDMDSQMKGARSTVASIRQSKDEDIEMSQMASPTLTAGAGLVVQNGQDGGAVTVRVARDADPLPEIGKKRASTEHSLNRLSHVSARTTIQQEPEEEKTWVVGADGEARLERRPSQRNSKRFSNQRLSGAPEVVPLPFKVPEALEGDVNDDRSSVATVAYDDEGDRNRHSKHLSAGSAFFNRLSRRSERNSRSFSRGQGGSTEDLVIPRAIEVEDDRASSIAATMDGLSDDEDMTSIRSSFNQIPNTDETRLHQSSVANSSFHLELPSFLTEPTVISVTEDSETNNSRPISEAMEDINIIKPKLPKGEQVDEPVTKRSLTSSTDPKPDSKTSSKNAISGEADHDRVEKREGGPTVESVVDSKPASISKERLPQLSKVVMSYRTNEWAKHLGAADAPDVDELKIAEYPSEAALLVMEMATPVNVDELQQTAENATPLARSASQMSNHIARTSSVQSRSYLTSNRLPLQDGGVSRSVSQQSLHRQSSQQSVNSRSMGFRGSSSSTIPQPIVESPIEEDISTFPNTQGVSKFTNQPMPFGSTSTLMGKRDTMLRSKTAYFGNSMTLAPTPEFPLYQNTPTGSDTGSIYNYTNTGNTTPMIVDDENMPMSARRELIRQSSVNQLHAAPLQQTPVSFDSHQPRRQSSAPSPLAREQQLASWRANVSSDLQSSAVPKHAIERSRSALLQERQVDEQRKAMDTRKRGQRDSAFDERMRRGDMLDAHREALRRMQASANKRA